MKCFAANSDVEALLHVTHMSINMVTYPYNNHLIAGVIGVITYG